MIIPTQTTAYENISQVVSSLMTSIYPYLIMVIGIIIGLYLVTVLVRIVRPESKDQYTYDDHGNVKFVEFDK